MSYALWLPQRLAARGLRVEVVPGWETRSAGSFAPHGAVCHWTAGPRGSTTRPSLNIVVNGRPDLAGPLCNVYGARDGTAVVVAAGRANHAGEGGFRGLVGNSAVLGTEMEAADGSDWTDAQRWAYPRINAAYCDGAGFDASWVCGHHEWAPTRKIDIEGYPMTTMRAQVAALLAGEDDDMPSAEEVADATWGKGIDKGASAGARLVAAQKLGEMSVRRLDSLIVTTTAMQAAVEALAAAKGVDPAEIKQTVSDAVDAALKDLKITLSTDAAA